MKTYVLVNLVSIETSTWWGIRELVVGLQSTVYNKALGHTIKKLYLSVYVLCVSKQNVWNMYSFAIHISRHSELVLTINEKHMGCSIAAITYWKHGVMITDNHGPCRIQSWDSLVWGKVLIRLIRSTNAHGIDILCSLYICIVRVTATTATR